MKPENNFGKRGWRQVLFWTVVWVNSILISEASQLMTEKIIQIAELEEGMLHLKEDLLQERTDARREKKELQKATVRNSPIFSGHAHNIEISASNAAITRRLCFHVCHNDPKETKLPFKLGSPVVCPTYKDSILKFPCSGEYLQQATVRSRPSLTTCSCCRLIQHWRLTIKQRGTLWRNSWALSAAWLISLSRNNNISQTETLFLAFREVDKLFEKVSTSDSVLHELRQVNSSWTATFDFAEKNLSRILRVFVVLGHFTTWKG